MVAREIQIAEWILNNYVLVTRAGATAANSVILECKAWGYGRHSVSVECTLDKGKLYHRNHGWVNDLEHYPGDLFVAGNADKVARYFKQQMSDLDWAMWRSICWERKDHVKMPLIVAARLRMISREFANPNQDLVVGCNLRLLEFDEHEMGIFCQWVDGKLYWTLRSDKKPELFNAINMDEVTESINAQAAEWAETHG